MLRPDDNPTCVIEIDRTASIPIAEQLVEQLRYHLAAGRYRTGERLPSTRKFAEQLGVSFHTVRKAYGKLEEEGMLSSRRGGGFFAAEPPPISSSERRERGAAIIQDALQRLVTLGLSDEETEYLFGEQLQFFESPGLRRKLLFAASFRERAEEIAEQLTGHLQERVEPIILHELGRHEAADVIMAALPDFQSAMQAVPDAETVAVAVLPAYAAVERAAHLGINDTVGLITRSSDAIEPLSQELRTFAGFGGQIIALPIEGEQRRLESLLRQVDLVLFTPQVRRRLRPFLENLPAVEWASGVTAEALVHIRKTVGR